MGHLRGEMWQSDEQRDGHARTVPAVVISPESTGHHEKTRPWGQFDPASALLPIEDSDQFCT